MIEHLVLVFQNIFIISYLYLCICVFVFVFVFAYLQGVLGENMHTWSVKVIEGAKNGKINKTPVKKVDVALYSRRQLVVQKLAARCHQSAAYLESVNQIEVLERKCPLSYFHPWKQQMSINPMCIYLCQNYLLNTLASNKKYHAPLTQCWCTRDSTRGPILDSIWSVSIS